MFRCGKRLGALAGLSRRERRAPYAPIQGGGYVVVGEKSLLVANETEVTQELPFHTIQQAVWEAALRVLTVKRVDPAQVDLVIQLATDDVERFSHALVDAVEHAVVYSAAVKLPGGRWARATVRRSSDGELLSDVVGTARDGADDAAVESLLRRVREVVGMAT